MSAPGHRDVEYASEVVQPGREAWCIMGRPEGLLPLKIDADVQSLAAFTIEGLGDMDPADMIARTGGKFSKGGWIRVKNRSGAPATFRCVVRYVPDTTKMENDIGRAIETAWREGTRTS